MKIDENATYASHQITVSDPIDIIKSCKIPCLPHVSMFFSRLPRGFSPFFRASHGSTGPPGGRQGAPGGGAEADPAHAATDGGGHEEKRQIHAGPTWNGMIFSGIDWVFFIWNGMGIDIFF